MNYITEKKHNKNIAQAWKATRNHTAAENIIYNALRGFDLRRGFTSITSAAKLNGGAIPEYGYEQALLTARFLILNRGVPIYLFKDESRLEAWMQRESHRIQQLSNTFGLEFTKELIDKLQERLA